MNKKEKECAKTSVAIELREWIECHFMICSKIISFYSAEYLIKQTHRDFVLLVCFTKDNDVFTKNIKKNQIAYAG